MIKRSALFFLIGCIFGLGLTISQMINPNKIQDFLDIFGTWDASLLFVMLGAVVTTFIGYRFVLKYPNPKLNTHFILPANKEIDMRLICGAAIFGVGWGLAGFCPGPAVTALGIGVIEPYYIVAGLLIGSALTLIKRQ